MPAAADEPFQFLDRHWRRYLLLAWLAAAAFMIQQRWGAIRLPFGKERLMREAGIGKKRNIDAGGRRRAISVSGPALAPVSAARLARRSRRPSPSRN